MEESTYDVVVVGAGFGGLGAALRLAERGARVLLLEALRYPGGCASTFARGGYRFEAGATLFAGLAPGQLFHKWIERYDLGVETEALDPVLELRGPLGSLPVAADKARFIDELCARDPEHDRALRRFFAEQSRAADLLWSVFDDPKLLPPFGPGALVEHLTRSPRYLSLGLRVGRAFGPLLDRAGVSSSAWFSTWADATSQITLQCPVAEAETPFAFASLDYPFRGAGHVKGGIGELAFGLCRAVERAGGEVRLARRVRSIERTPDGFRVHVTKDGVVHTRAVVANLLPQALNACLDEPLPALERRADRVRDGWGAAMLYRVAAAPTSAPRGPHHLELVDDDDAPFEEGNHVFVSVSGADEARGGRPGERTLTLSTHVRVSELRALGDADRAARVAEVQERMRRTVAKRAPEWANATVSELTASPRTFERFTGRPEGLVGGVPRTAGLSHYLGALPRPVADGLYLVGDSVFPGQSTLAVALSGVKTAEVVEAAA